MAQPLKVVAERRRTAAQPELQPSQLTQSRFDAARNGLGPNALLTMAEAAVYLRYHDERCAAKCRCADICRQFLQRHGVPLSHRGRVSLVRQRYLDDVLALAPGARWIDHHARKGTRLSVAR